MSLLWGDHSTVKVKMLNRDYAPAPSWLDQRRHGLAAIISAVIIWVFLLAGVWQVVSWITGR